MKVACTSIVAAPRFRAVNSAGRSEVDVVASLRAPGSSKRSIGVRLRQDAVDDVTSDVGEAEVASLVAVGKPLVVDPQ